MKRIATGLLLAAAAVYALATAFEGRHPVYGYVAAFSEAAMIGAIADWFAVTALFRHPLGLPIPHTAIIPRNKGRIGRELANFICGNFLQTEAVLGHLRRFGPADRLAGWLASPVHAQVIAGHVVAAARYGLEAFDDERVRRFVGEAALSRLDRLDLAPLAGQLLQMLTVDGRHQAVLDGVLRQLARILEDEEVHAKIADSIALEVRYLSLIGLDNVAGRLAARKIVAGVGRLIGEMSEDPAHPLRLRFDELMAEFIDRLQHDPALQARAETLKSELLSQPALADYLHGLWDQLLSWLRDDLGREDSSVRQRVVDMSRGMGARLQGDNGMREWIDDQLLTAAPRWIERYREDIRRTIVEQVDSWDTADLTTEVERHIGRDLQFVRINGTLVGGLIGLTIHAVTQWARGA